MALAKLRRNIIEASSTLSVITIKSSSPGDIVPTSTRTSKFNAPFQNLFHTARWAMNAIFFV